MRTPRARNAAWKKRIRRVIGRRSVGVAVAGEGRLVYSHEGRKPRVPASNEKLLLSMALLDRFGPRFRVPTRAAASHVSRGVIKGNLWIIGRGDPTLTAHEPGYWGDVRATTLAALARRLKQSGVTRVNGRVMGASNYFAHDLSAPGWRSYVPREYVELPASLVLNGNNAGKPHPERDVAVAFTSELERAGVSVKGKPGAGKLPQRLSTLATVRSAPLAAILSFTERTSNNFFAEMLGKLLGASTFGPPGTISKGARAIEEWVRHHGATAVAHDSSGLSLKNRISPKAIVTLLAKAQHQPWGAVLREGLAAPGEGTLGYRMVHLDVRAKTGTLFDGISALSGWVRNQRSGHWTAFSILDRDTPKEVEDKIVAAIARAHIAAKLNGGRKCNNNPG